jgi:hypothetical protein
MSDSGNIISQAFDTTVTDGDETNKSNRATSGPLMNDKETQRTTSTPTSEQPANPQTQEVQSQKKSKEEEPDETVKTPGKTVKTPYETEMSFIDAALHLYPQPSPKKTTPDTSLLDIITSGNLENYKNDLLKLYGNPDDVQVGGENDEEADAKAAAKAAAEKILIDKFAELPDMHIVALAIYDMIKDNNNNKKRQRQGSFRIKFF